MASVNSSRRRVTISRDVQQEAEVSERQEATANGMPPTRRGEKMSELIARDIVHDIVSRGLERGAKLPAEAVMLDQLQVGRATLREALRILEVHGLISIRPGPGGGPVVASAKSKDFGRMATLFFHMQGATFRELIEARQVVEPLMARLAAERQDIEDMSRLSDAIEGARSAAVGEDTGWALASSGFHDVVAGMSGNRILDLFGEAIKEVWFDRVTGTMYPSDAREQVRRDHETIAKAIVAGDGRKAERLMRAHMQEWAGFVADRYPGLLDEVVDWR
jgi:DNA-binding FadR family transcriptional regulator